MLRDVLMLTVSGFNRKEVIKALSSALADTSSANCACLLAAELACSASASSGHAFDARGVVCILVEEYARWHAGANLTLVTRIANSAAAACVPIRRSDADADGDGKALCQVASALCELVLLVMTGVLSGTGTRRDQVRRMKGMRTTHAQEGGTKWVERLRGAVDSEPRHGRATSIATVLSSMLPERGVACTWLTDELPQTLLDDVRLPSAAHRRDSIWHAWGAAVSMATSPPGVGKDDDEYGSHLAFVRQSLRVYSTCFRIPAREVRLPLLWYALRVLGPGAAPHTPETLGVPVLDDAVLMGRTKQAFVQAVQAVLHKLSPCPVLAPPLEESLGPDPRRVPPVPSSFPDPPTHEEKRPPPCNYLQVVVRVGPSERAACLEERQRMFADLSERNTTAGVRSVAR